MSVSVFQLLSQLVQSTLSKPDPDVSVPVTSAESSPAPSDYKYFSSSKTRGTSDVPTLSAFMPSPETSETASSPSGRTLNVNSRAYPHNSLGDAGRYDSLVYKTAQRINVSIDSQDMNYFRDEAYRVTGRRLNIDELKQFVRERTASMMVKMVGGNEAKLEEFFSRDNGSADGLKVEISSTKTTEVVVSEGSYEGSTSAAYCTSHGQLCFSPEYFTDDHVLLHELAHGYDSSDAGFWKTTGSKEINGLTEEDESLIESAYDRLKTDPELKERFFRGWSHKDYGMTNRAEFFAELWSFWDNPNERWRIEQNFPELVPVMEKLTDANPHVHSNGGDHDHEHGVEGHSGETNTGHANDMDDPKANEHSTDTSPTESGGDSDAISGGLSADTSKRSDLKAAIRQLKALAREKHVYGKLASVLGDLSLDVLVLNMKNEGRLASIIGRIQAAESKIHLLSQGADFKPEVEGSQGADKPKTEPPKENDENPVGELDITGLKGQLTDNTLTVGAADTYEKIAKTLVANNPELAAALSQRAEASGISVEDYVAQELKRYNTEQHPRNRDQWPWQGDVININQALKLTA